MSDDEYGFDIDDSALLAAVTAAESKAASSSKRKTPPSPPRPVQPAQLPPPSNPTLNANSPTTLPVVSAPVPPPHLQTTLHVSERQKSNPLLRHLPKPWTIFPENTLLSDFATPKTAILFLSLKYHLLFPHYLPQRLAALTAPPPPGARPRPTPPQTVLLLLLDAPETSATLKALASESVRAGYTLLCAWSAQEAAHYISLFWTVRDRLPTAIMARKEQGPVEVLKLVPKVNKVDVAALLSTFGSVGAAVRAESEELSKVGGWGVAKCSAWERAMGGSFRGVGEGVRVKRGVDADVAAKLGVVVQGGGEGKGKEGGGGGGEESGMYDIDEDEEEAMRWAMEGTNA